MIRIINSVLVLFAFLFTSVDVACTQELEVETIYFEAPALHKALVLHPSDFSPDLSYDLVIGLTGAGGTAEQMVGIWSGLGVGRPFIYVAAQPAYSFLLPDGGLGYDWWLYFARDTVLMRRAASSSAVSLVELVSRLKSTYNVKETYLIGFSLGSLQAYLTAFSNPDVFSGVIGFAGAFSESWFERGALREASNVRVFMAVGRDDVGPPRNMYEWVVSSKPILDGHGFDVELVEFDGGHTMPSDVLGQALRWIQRQ